MRRNSSVPAITDREALLNDVRDFLGNYGIILHSMRPYPSTSTRLGIQCVDTGLWDITGEYRQIRADGSRYDRKQRWTLQIKDVAMTFTTEASVERYRALCALSHGSTDVSATLPLRAAHVQSAGKQLTPHVMYLLGPLPVPFVIVSKFPFVNWFGSL